MFKVLIMLLCGRGQLQRPSNIKELTGLFYVYQLRCVMVFQNFKKWTEKKKKIYTEIVSGCMHVPSVTHHKL